jgi:hypothetical protein
MSGLAILSLAISLAVTPLSATAGQKNWSVDLGRYNLNAGHENASRNHKPTILVAATNGAVAVAWGTLAHPAEPGVPDNWWSKPWEVNLLLFDANNGKLKAKSGPWSSDFSFELYPTAKGNFLLFLRHFHDAKQNPGETLYLLSSSGKELKKLDLLPSIRGSKPSWNEFLVSSSGGTVLLGQILEDGVHYRLLESDTLETKLEWTREAGSDSPGIVALSDKELLGFHNVKNQEKPGLAGSERDVYVRSFDGPWRPLHATLDVSSHGGLGQGLHPTQLAFLSDSVIVGVNAKRKELEGSILVLQSDGTVLSPPVIPKLPDRTNLTGPVAVSTGGRYFAVGFQHQPWMSHLLVDVMTMDITFWNDDSLFLIWEASNPEPVARIPMGTDVRALSLAPDDPPTLAFVNGSSLKVVHFQVKTSARAMHTNSGIFRACRRDRPPFALGIGPVDRCALPPLGFL